MPIPLPFQDLEDEIQVKEFNSHLVVMTDGRSVVVAPSAALADSLREEDLEREIVQHPQLLGEDLLVLGSQLAEFTEDRERLDVLAVDRDGEIVLVELKAADSYRVTDLQALAYAAAYSNVPTDRLARTLRRTLERNRGVEVPLESAQAELVTFITHLESFDEWEPSRHVRIKLVAPAFPQRVLATVKWLGDVYAMPIEAIQVQLYESGGARHLTFERLLPVKGADAFDLTVRDAERRVQRRNQSRRPDVVRTLLDAGEIANGTELWYLKRSHEFPAALRSSIADDDPRFCVRVDATGTKPRFQWIGPSVSAVAPDHRLGARPYRSVYRRYSLTPGGETLGDLAQKRGLWAPDEDEDD